MRVEIMQTGLEYDGFIRIEKAELAFEKFSGEMSGAVRRYRYHRGDAVAVMIYDGRRDRVLLIRQFRYAVHARTGDGWLIECVAGIQEKGESVETVARREVLEETGLKLAGLELLAEYFFSPGGCSDKVHLFLGSLEDPEQSLGVHGVAQEEEDIQACWVPLSRALEMADAGQIQDAKTLIGLHLLERRLRRGTGADGADLDNPHLPAMGLQRAEAALGTAGAANPPAVVNEAMGKVDPFPGGDEGHEVLLDFLRGSRLGQAKSPRNPKDVGVDHHPRGHPEGRPKHDIGCFSGYSGEFEELLHGLRHLPVVLFHQAAAGLLDVPGLVAEESGGMNHPFQGLQGGAGKGFCRRVFAKELRRDQVDSLVGALGRKDGRDQQLQRSGVSQGALGPRIGLLQARQDAGHLPLAGFQGFFRVVSG